ncbi:PIN domain-containing protein [Streptacidiphilus sp. MAP5-3]|uniref:PIN domain-containing protein n=1 Tax=unclassified Streptacidiphilus TaxID=2643834 RepID=UPI0035149796
MAFVVVYDSCVLYPNVVRDLLIRVAQAGMVQAKWTDLILDEMSRALHLQRGTAPDRLERLRRLMSNSIRDVRVIGYEPLVTAVKLPDPDDRHVLAAAIKAKAQVIRHEQREGLPRGCPRRVGRRGADGRLIHPRSARP